MPNLELHIGGRTIVCQTADDRNLLREADAIAEDPTVVQHLSVGRLMLIKDACQFYSLGKLAMDRRQV